MNFPLDRNSVFANRPRSRPWGKFALVLAMVFAITYFIGDVIALGLRPLALRITGSSGKAVAQLSGASSGISFRTKASLMRENQRLEAALGRQEILQLRLRQIEQENVLLREILGRSDGVTPSFIPAKILLKPNRSPYDVLIIDLGTSTSRVSVGNQVGVDQAIIGQITEVAGKTARVRLYSSPGVELPILLGTSSLSTTAKGIGGGNYQISLPRVAEVAVGDIVTTSVAPGFILGQIGSIDDAPNQPFKTILFRSPINWFELTWVDLYAN